MRPGARLDPRSLHTLSSGVEPARGPLATKPWTAAIEVRLNDGHQGARVKPTIACRARSPFYCARFHCPGGSQGACPLAKHEAAPHARGARRGRAVGGERGAEPGRGKKGFPKGKKPSVSFPLGYGRDSALRLRTPTTPGFRSLGARLSRAPPLSRNRPVRYWFPVGRMHVDGGFCGPQIARRLRGVDGALLPALFGGWPAHTDPAQGRGASWRAPGCWRKPAVPQPNGETACPRLPARVGVRGRRLCVPARAAPAAGGAVGMPACPGPPRLDRA
jgi:hypothetical protein